MKVCTCCAQPKPLTDFHKNGRSGFHSVCKPCACEKRRASRAANPELHRAADRAKYERNLAKKKAAISAYYEANKERIRKRNRERYRLKSEQIRLQTSSYRAANKDKVYEWNGTRRAALRKALPCWADRAAIRAIYAEAKRLTAETGIDHHVDHVVPLTNELVCGLHVPANLQVVTALDNLKKSNRL